MAESVGNEQIFHLLFTVCVILCYNTYDDIMSYNNPFPHSDDSKCYHTWNYYLKHRFRSKVFKAPLNVNLSCPSRDGTCGVGGCTFCSALSSGDYAGDTHDGLFRQFDQGMQMMQRK